MLGLLVTLFQHKTSPVFFLYNICTADFTNEIPANKVHLLIPQTRFLSSTSLSACSYRRGKDSQAEGTQQSLLLYLHIFSVSWPFLTSLFLLHCAFYCQSDHNSMIVDHLHSFYVFEITFLFKSKATEMLSFSRNKEHLYFSCLFISKLVIVDFMGHHHSKSYTVPNIIFSVKKTETKFI